MNVRRDRIEDEIVRALKKIECLGPENEWDDTTFTLEVKRALTEIGKARGYVVRASNPEAHEHGWLFDMTWRKEKGGWLLSLPLVLESEADGSLPS